jgi:hypothetical protein
LQNGCDTLRTHPHKQTIFLNDNELNHLLIKTKKTGLSKSAFIRMLITGYAPKEKPDDRFYEVMREISAIGNNLNQLARKAAALNYIDVPQYKKEAEEWRALRMAIKREFLEPEQLK